MQLELNNTYAKILLCVSSLNKENAYPQVDGVKKILKGELDIETERFKDSITFSTLISLGNRQLCSDVKMLVRYGYLRYIYEEKTDKYYLKITEKGEIELDKYLSKHKLNLKKSYKKIKPTILFK